MSPELPSAGGTRIEGANVKEPNVEGANVQTYEVSDKAWLAAICSNSICGHSRGAHRSVTPYNCNSCDCKRFEE